jgi:hypothetical protein
MYSGVCEIKVFFTEMGLRMQRRRAFVPFAAAAIAAALKSGFAAMNSTKGNL